MAEKIPWLPFRRPRAMLVEDQIQQLDRRRQLLRLRDVEVVPATSKQEAILRLQTLSYDIEALVTDLNLNESQVGLIEGVDVAEAVADHSGNAIPSFAYSGKTMALPPQSRRLFIEVSLKSSSFDESRRLLDSAVDHATVYFDSKVRRATAILGPAMESPTDIAEQEWRLLRNLVAGASAETSGKRPEAVGLLQIADGKMAVPYAIASRLVGNNQRYYASTVGHEYLYGYASTPDSAADSLRDVITGFAQTVQSDDTTTLSVGASKRLRRFLRTLATHDAGGFH
jgi:CheY-like chemotaxis protein